MATKKKAGNPAKKPVVLPSFFGHNTHKEGANKFSFGCGSVVLTRQEIADFLLVETTISKRQRDNWQKTLEEVNDNGSVSSALLAKVKILLNS